MFFLILFSLQFSRDDKKGLISLLIYIIRGILFDP